MFVVRGVGVVEESGEFVWVDTGARMVGFKFGEFWGHLSAVMVGFWCFSPLSNIDPKWPKVGYGPTPCLGRQILPMINFWCHQGILSR